MAQQPLSVLGRLIVEGSKSHTHTHTHTHTQKLFLPLSFSVGLLRTSDQLVAELVEASCHKPEGRMFDPSGRTMALGSTQPLTVMNTRDLPWR